MTFDNKKFKRTKFKQRTEAVPVADLADFFPDDEEPVWEVRGLTGQELGRTKEAAAKNKNMSALVDALESSVDSDKIDAMRTALGVGEETPQNIAERLEQLVLGSVAPECDMETAVLLCERFPIEFYTLTNTVLKLTGKGMEPGKRKDSGTTPESAPQ